MTMLWVLMALSVLDAFYVFYKLDGAYSLEEMGTNFLTMLGAEGLRRLTFFWRLGIFTALHQLSPLRAPLTVGWLLVCYLGVDFLYYWKHRLLHEIPLGWALHGTHHSSRELNISTGMRTNWIQRVWEDLVFAPMTLLGFDPLAVLLLAELNLFSLLWVHTRIRGPWRWMERVFNTPAAHRVHHASARELSSCNYGATLLIWDHLFGTYRAEPAGAEVAYGVEEGHPGYNPFTIQFIGLWRLLRGLLARAT